MKFIEVNLGATRSLINLDKVQRVELAGGNTAKFVMDDEKTAYHTDMPYETAKRLLALN